MRPNVGNLPGAVDAATGNVPLVLSEGFRVHFIAGGVSLRVRISGSMPGPVLEFAGSVDLWVYLMQMPLSGRCPDMLEVAEWVELRTVERP